jgi:hypothetical protein
MKQKQQDKNKQRTEDYSEQMVNIAPGAFPHLPDDQKYGIGNADQNIKDSGNIEKTDQQDLGADQIILKAADKKKNAYYNKKQKQEKQELSDVCMKYILEYHRIKSYNEEAKNSISKLR